MGAKRFCYVSVGMLALTIAYLVGFEAAQKPARAASAEIDAPLSERLQAEFASVAAKVNPTVVNIDVEKPSAAPHGGRSFGFGPGMPLPPELRDFFGMPDRPQRGRGGGGGAEEAPKSRTAGSGVIIDAKGGYIATNAHVVNQATRIGVTLIDGSSHEAELVGVDVRTDLAVVKIDADDLQQIEFGDSDAIEVGHIVLAFGQPEGLKYTVTQGIVSAKGRAELGIIRGPEGAVGYEDFIQTDAAVNPGNSGGPLTDIHGRLVGINTAIATAGVAQFGGISFAIPSEYVRDVTAELIANGEVVRGWIGVTIGNLSYQGDEVVAKYGTDGAGVFVASVSPGQPADEGGVRPEDVIVGFDGSKVATTRALRTAVASAKVGSTKKLEVVRIVEGKPERLTLEVAIAKQPKNLAVTESDVVTTDIGVSVQTLDEKLARAFGYERSEKGVVVTEVIPGGRADKAGVQVGDLVSQVKYQGKGIDIESTSDLTKALSGIPEGEPFALRLKRDGQVSFVPVD